MTGQTEAGWRREKPLDKGEAQAVERDQAERRPALQPVVVVDINIGFDSLIKLMVKIALASIPAAIILAVIFTIGSLVLSAALSS